MVTKQQANHPTANIAAFLQMLQQQPDEADCRLCLRQLPDYVVAQQAGEPYRAQFEWTALHLDSCVACAQAYGLLFETILAETMGELPQLESIPTPDLSFLTAVSDLATILKQTIQHTRQRLTIQLNDRLIALLVPSSQTVLSRSPDADRYTPQLLALTPEHAPEMTLPITLTAYTDRQQPGYCLVEVMVEPPGMSWPDLGGRVVTVTIEEQAQTAQTDEWGTAVFPDILIDDLDILCVDVAF